MPVSTHDEAAFQESHDSMNWGMLKVQAYQSWRFSRGEQTKVAVLDTGIDGSHESLTGRVIAEINFSDSPTVQDVCGHGTHIAGIIAGRENDNATSGLAPEAKLMNVKVADDMGRSEAAWVAKGINWAVDNGANIINISIELMEQPLELQDAVERAVSHDVLVIAASGNHASGLPVYPAYYMDSIAVSASRQDDSPAPLSNRGEWVDVTAPGFNIYSTLPGNAYGYKTGTSVATAYVSGLAALLFSVADDYNGDGKVNDELRLAIEQGCQALDASGMGKGRIDAFKSLAIIQQWGQLKKQSSS